MTRVWVVGNRPRTASVARAKRDTIRPQGGHAMPICRCELTDESHTLSHLCNQGVKSMYDGGTFGGYTRWAVVFLIIFVLFFLLVPAYGATGAGY